MHIPFSKYLILYGPPGTGKAFQLKNKFAPFFTKHKKEITRKDALNRIAENYTWWQFVAAAVLDLDVCTVTDILNHELIKAKDRVTDQQNPRAMIWSMLQQHTGLECENVHYSKRFEPYLFSKDKN